MRTRFLAVTVVWCLIWPAIPRGAESTHDYAKIRAALRRPAPPSRFAVKRASLPDSPARVTPAGGAFGDSMWDGFLIGAGVGVAGGYLWGRSLCGSNDQECSVISTRAGMLGGAAIGGAIGAIIDALHK